MFGATSLDRASCLKRSDNLKKLTEIVYDKFGVNLFQLATCAIAIRHATGMNAGILPHLDIIHRVAYHKCLSWLNAQMLKRLIDRLWMGLCMRHVVGTDHMRDDFL